jgi:hypothetical protein
MGEAITNASVLTCPHGGTVTITPTSGLLIDESAAAAVTDEASISGCPEADPCTSVQWATSGVLVVGGQEIAMFPELSSCITAGGANTGPPIVSTGLGGAIVAN